MVAQVTELWLQGYKTELAKYIYRPAVPGAGGPKQMYSLATRFLHHAGDGVVAARLQNGAGEVHRSAVARRRRPAAALGGRFPHIFGCGVDRAGIQHATARLEGMLTSENAFFDLGFQLALSTLPSSVL